MKAVGCSLLLLVCFICIALVYWVFFWPPPGRSPHLFPGVEAPKATYCPGSWGCATAYTYTVDLAPEAVEKYYFDQMAELCEGNWRFERTAEREGLSDCRMAECSIPRTASYGHMFRITLCRAVDGRTFVEHTDFLQD
jgi:hypothetical protein